MKRKLGIVITTLLLLITFMGIVMIRNNSGLTKEQEMVVREYITHNKLIVEYVNKVKKNSTEVKKELENLIEKENNPLYLGTYNIALSYYYAEVGDYENHKFHGIKALKSYSSKFEGKALVLYTYQYLIENSIYFSDFTNALGYCYDLGELLQDEDFSYLPNNFEENLEVIVDCNFINIFTANGLKDEAQEYYNKLMNMEITPSVYEENKQLIVFSKLLYFDSQKDAVGILEYSKQYYKIIEKVASNRKGINMAEVVRMNIANGYLLLDKPNEAKEHLDAAYKEIVRQKEINPGFHGDILSNYALYYQLMGDIEKSIDYLKQAFEVYDNSETVYPQILQVVENMMQLKQEYALGVDITEYTKKYVEYSEDVEIQKGVTSLFSKMVDINDKQNESKLLLQERETIAMKKNKKLMNFGIVVLSIIVVVLGYLLFFLNIQVEKRKESEKMLRDMINKDYLTGAFTRTFGMDRIKELIGQDKDFYIGMIDIDNFKKINDNYGHGVGDKALIEVAKTLKDVIKEFGYVVRYGGEEFLIVLDVTNKDIAYNLMELGRQSISELIFEEGIIVTISGGVSHWDNSTITEVINNADELLYKAKHSGKNKIEM